MNEKRHAEFHDTFAWNRPPLTLTRLIALHAVGYRELMLHPDTMEDLFAETTLPRWHRLYDDGAVANNWRPDRLHLRAKADEFHLTHAAHELSTVEQLMSCMENGGRLPWQSYGLLPSFLRFFGTDNPTGAILRMYDERSNGDLAWTKCLHDDVRHDILDLFQERKVPFDRGCKRDMRIVLSQQRDRLLRCMSRWQRDVQLACA